jgi:hypothetical protein
MSAAFWFRKEPPPNNLISRRCSDLVNSSQGIAEIVVLPVILVAVRASDPKGKRKINGGL